MQSLKKIHAWAQMQDPLFTHLNRRDEIKSYVLNIYK